MLPIREHCGVAGFYAPFGSDISHDLYSALGELSHRGQQSYGMATVHHDGKKGTAHYKTRTGSISKGFSPETLKEFAGYMGIGHVRYGTSGSNDQCNEQPMLFRGRAGPFWVAYNGNNKHHLALRRRMEEESGIPFESDADTEVLGRMIAEGNDVAEGLEIVNKEWNGSASIVVMTKDGLYAYRDSRGIKPLYMKRGEGTVAFASESCALDLFRSLEEGRDIERGEIYYKGQDGEYSKQLEQNPWAFDIFEWVYFARPDSMIDGVSVGMYRFELGKRQGEKERERGTDHPAGTIVCEVPYSGTYAAEGFAQELGLHHISLLFRKRSDRSFTLPTTKNRLETIRKKFSVIESMVKQYGSSILLVDDSNIRGNTGKMIAGMLRRAGAESIHARYTFPEILHTCPFGIDMRNEEEHAARRRPVREERAQYMGFDSLDHLDPEDLILAANRMTGRTYTQNDFCMRCATGIDPPGTG